MCFIISEDLMVIGEQGNTSVNNWNREIVYLPEIQCDNKYFFVSLSSTTHSEVWKNFKKLK